MVEPLAEIVGVVGDELVVTVIPADVAEQVPELIVTEYVPAVFTVIDCVVSPVLQVLPNGSLDVKIRLSPRHNELEPFKLIVGAERVVVVVTVIPVDVAEHPPELTVTV
jgi:hypothetical protein